MIIVVRVGLGLAYQGASSRPHHGGGNNQHDPSSSAPSSRRQNVEQLSTFQAASRHGDPDLKSISMGTSSSGTKIDSRTGLDSNGISGEKDGEKMEEKTIRNRGLVGGDDDVV